MRTIRMLMIALAIISAYSLKTASAEDLCNKSSAAVSAEIEGLGAPDAKFVIASVENVDSGLLDRVSKASVVGDQGSQQLAQTARSTGCSTGCSSGCSTGCSSGCSTGCSVGCR